MAQTTLGGTPVTTRGELPQKGSGAPSFTLVTTDLSELSSADLVGKKVVLNIFPSVDTRVCAASVRQFNTLAAGLDNTVVVNMSADLPFAQRRFCGAEGIDNAELGSTFRNPEVLRDLGVQMVDGAFKGLAARAVIVIDEEGTVIHSQLVPEIDHEPDYDAALDVL